MATLRNRLEKSRFLAALLGRIAGSYLRLCNRTTRWDVQGLAEMKADLAKGPVLLVLWHQHSLLAHLHWPRAAGDLTSLYANSPVGRVAGALQRQAGHTPMEMREGASNLANSRAILKRMKAGASIGMTVDGPEGPGFEVKAAPLEWARVMQCPVWGYAFETARGRELSTWDKMHFPAPFGRGRLVFRRWNVEMPRKFEGDQLEMLQKSLQQHLNDLSKAF